MKDYSQRGEQLVIAKIFATLGIEKGRLIDLGAGDGYTLSNTRALLENGWTGDLYDGDPRGAKDVHKVWLNENELKMIACACIGDNEAAPDFLNIDVDGNDYWFLNWFLEITKPSLIVAEFNPIFQRDEAVVMAYNPSHVWNNDTYYGMSLAACEQLGKKHGYTLIHLHGGINAFLLRSDLAEKHPELFGDLDYKIKFGHKPHPHGKQWTRLN